MANESIIKLFEGNQVRILWNETEEKYYFSVVDIPKESDIKLSQNLHKSEKFCTFARQNNRAKQNNKTSHI